jgi:Xaa-Pro aminopeptidase
MKVDLPSRKKGFADAYQDKILPMRARAAVRNQWLAQRLDNILPEIMVREGIDMWIVIAREYNEDPVIMSLLPQPAMSARRRTILVFYLREDQSLERLTLDRYGLGDYYEAAWDPEQREQHSCLSTIVKERDPNVIGINTALDSAFGDGLTQSEHQRLLEALGEAYMSRTQSAVRLAIGWLERRSEAELTVYPGIAEIGHAIIAEAFSSRVIQPGITTTDDVEWWIRQKILDLGLRAWFQPTVDIQAAGQGFQMPVADHAAAPRTLILPGDLLHCDVGFHYLGLATDQQQNAYVLRPGETDAPAGLRAVLEEGNRLQDILADAMVTGRTGNEILRTALEQARAEGLSPSIYTHPLGYHGHGAGPTIGLWDRQEGVPGRGDYELFDDTVYAIELNVSKEIAEWDGQKVVMALEEDAAFSKGCLQWLPNRQTSLHLIG